MNLAAFIDFFRSNFLSMCRYIVVGIFVYGVEYISYLSLILYCSVAPLYANAAAKIIAGFIAYFFHRIYTFQKSFYEGLYKDLVKYVAVLLFNVPLFSVIFYAVNLFGLDYKVTKIIADIFCIAIAYLQTRFLVFNTTSK
jgi:putative flippase GtrA